MMKLSEKTILITGASSGIGKAMAIRAAQDGGTVLLASRNKEKLEEVKSKVESLGANAEVMPTDVTDSEQIKEMFLKATKDGRVLDVVFNNAGLGFIGEIQELTEKEIQKMIAVNLTGMIMVSKYASEVMVRQKYGHIVMTSSLAGLITIPQWSVYAATKWGITGFAGSIRAELAQYNVKVSTLHPGAVATGFFDKDKANIDIGKVSGDMAPTDPSIIADAVYDALFTDKKKIIVPRVAQNYALMYRFLPGLVEKELEKTASEVEYGGEAKKEDSPEFDYVKEV